MTAVIGTPVGGLSTQVYSMERQLAEYKANSDLNVLLDRFQAVARLHPEVHGPEDMNWCPTCSTNWPCPTRQAIGI